MNNLNLYILRSEEIQIRFNPEKLCPTEELVYLHLHPLHIQHTTYQNTAKNGMKSAISLCSLFIFHSQRILYLNITILLAKATSSNYIIKSSVSLPGLVDRQALVSNGRSDNPFRIG